MGRPTCMPEPLASLAKAAGSVERLRSLMDDVSPTTLRRWGSLLREGKPLPRAAMAAIKRAQAELSTQKEEG